MRIIAAVVCLAASAFGAVTRVDITDRSEIKHAGYIRLAGTVHFALDPKLAANHKIADIDFAKKNAQGQVEFTSDFLIYLPKDPKKSNGTALVEIPNRGGITLISGMQVNARGRGVSPEDLGDKFLFEQGFTMVWIGWQHDVPAGPGVIRLHPPTAEGVRGWLHSEILVDRLSKSESLGDRNMIPYTVLNPTTARMTVRDTPDSERKPIPQGYWSLDVAAGRVEYPAGFEPGKIYDVFYQSQNPAVAGTGMAAVRDFAMHLRQSGIDSFPPLRHTIAFGSSQSGRFLRTYLYDGFNADEFGKQVFDGMWLHISGAARGGFNQRFAQPSRMAGQWNGVANPIDLEPSTPGELLAPGAKAHVAPKLMLTNGSHEYWGRAASLNHADSKRDLALSKDVRMYYLAGAQHSTAADTNNMRNVVQQQTNPLEWRWLMRALLTAMQTWVVNGAEPPPSKIPLLSAGELVPANEVKFPKVPGVMVPPFAYAPRTLDFGPEFISRGIATIEPPKEGPRRGVLVPQVNRDGNESSGIVMPELRFPLATYTGWNLRDPRSGSTSAMYPLLGSMIPFARTKGERERNGDPRPSIEERYRNQREYLTRIELIARELAAARLVLESDIPLIVGRAKARWEQLTGPVASK